MTAGGQIIAQWDDGKTLVAAGARPNRADLGFFPPSSDATLGGPNNWVSTTDGAKLMTNALTYVQAALASGACCRPDGTCIFGPASDCNAAQGAFQGSSVACGSVSCPQPGACCSTNGSCSFVAQFACPASTSVFSGVGVDCASANCPGGACCKRDGSCATATQSWCESTGGIFAGNGVACASAACAQPGACCLPSGGCVSLIAADCTTAAGTFGGAGVLCASANCWSAPVLYNNGGLVTHPAQASGGANASLLAPGAAVVGENWAFAAGVRVADDFTIPPGQSWTLNRFRAFGYQTSAPTSPVPYNGMYVRIWDRDPRAAGATILWGDLTTNLIDIASSSWAGLYRVLTLSPGETTRAVFNLAASIPNVTLTPGTYWVEFSATNATTPFIPGVSCGTGGPDSVIPFGNAIIWRNSVGSWQPVLDISAALNSGYKFASWSNAGGFPYGLPFILEGSTAEYCACPGDVNHDMHVDGIDVQSFVDCLLGGATGCRCADVDGATGVTSADVDPFVALLLAGTDCP